MGRQPKGYDGRDIRANFSEPLRTRDRRIQTPTERLGVGFGGCCEPTVFDFVVKKPGVDGPWMADIISVGSRKTGLAG